METVNRVGGRFIIKKTDKPNETPSISKYESHTSGMWKSTDIYEGELFINTSDNRMWFRNNNNEVVEIPVLDNKKSKIKDNYLPDLYGKLNYLGLWSTESNLYPSSPAKTDYYIISDNGVIEYVDYNIGDFIVYNGKFWDKVNNNTNKIYSSSIIYDESTDKKLIDYINEIVNKIDFEEQIITKSITIKDDVEFFILNKDDFKYKDNLVYHSGNSNNIDSDWTSKQLNTIDIISKNITSENIKVSNIEIEDIKINGTIGIKNINSESLDTSVVNCKSLYVSDGRINLEKKSTYIKGDGKGISMVYLTKKVFEYDSFQDINIFGVNMRYNSEKTFDNDLDIVTKKYIDDKFEELLSLINNKK